MIQLTDVSLSFGGTSIFDGLSWTITPQGHRIGLIGPNGAGKTTLLKVIAGEQPVDEGRVERGSTSVGYLEQDIQEMPADRSVRQEALRAFDDVLEMERKEEQITQQLSEATDYESDGYEKLLDRLQRVQEQLNAREAHRIRPQADATLTGLGFDPDDLDRPLRTFSGGWRMRVALAKLLLQRPDVLLLDEPTNHLDIDSIDWLEGYLKNYPGTVIIVSHDRYFLDRMVTDTAELTRGRIALYDGNYSYYLEAREERREQWRNAYENQQKRIKEIEEFISRFRYNASKASQVQSRIKKLEKMDRIPEPPSDDATITFRFPEPRRSGRVVMELSQFSKTYESEEGPVDVFDDAGPLTIERGDKIALVGPNGAGKSTLARILGGSESFEGDRSIGHNVDMGFFAQHQADTLDPSQTVLDAVREVSPGTDETELRTLLGTFLFRGDDVFKHVRVLSGGERSRVALARTLLSPANFLILDEPTNHLDIQSKQVLIEALQQYGGTFVIVSHDRHFLDEVVEEVWRVGHGGVRTFLGNYSEYRWQVEEGTASAFDEFAASEAPPGTTHSSTRGADGASGGGSNGTSGGTSTHTSSSQRNGSAGSDTDDSLSHLNSYQVKKKLEETEAAILEKEERQEELESAMADPDAYSDGGRARELSREYNALKEDLAGLYDAWETLTDRVMALEDE
jgi:ATP-binding cassette subfamily F protein 3